MPKNKGKGGKNRRRGKNENEGVKRELIFKEDGQEYAQVGVSHVTQLFSYVKSFPRSLRCLVMDVSRPCALTELSVSVTSEGNFARR